MGNSHPMAGENIEEEDNHGVKDWTFSLIELHWTSFGCGIALIFGLILLYNLIRMSSVQTWARLLNFLVPCCNIGEMWHKNKLEEREYSYIIIILM